MEYVEEVIKSLLPEDLILLPYLLEDSHQLSQYECRQQRLLIVRKSCYSLHDDVGIFKKAPNVLCLVTSADTKLYISGLEMVSRNIDNANFHKNSSSICCRTHLEHFQLDSDYYISGTHIINICDPHSIAALRGYISEFIDNNTSKPRGRHTHNFDLNALITVFESELRIDSLEIKVGPSYY